MTRAQHPGQLKPFVFSQLVSAAERIGGAMPPRLRSVAAVSRGAFHHAFLAVSPSVPVDLARVLGQGPLRSVVGVTFAAGLFFSLFLTGFFCWIEGTLLGSSVDVPFLRDGYNLFLYAFVTPSYVALSIGLVVLTIRHWAALAEFSDQVTAVRAPRPHRLGLALIIGFGLASISTANYMAEVLDPARVGDVYWFVRQLSDGTRSLNRAGFYYVALNFVLLLITLLGIAAFFSLTLEVLRVGHSLRDGKVESFNVLRQRLTAFTTAYLIAKWLAAIYLVNAFVWKHSPLGGDGSSNLVATGIALTLVGVFFLAVPRLYVELRWFQFVLVGQEGAEGEDAYRDLRPRHVMLWAQVLDVVLISGGILAFWDISLDPNALIESIQRALSSS